MEISSDADSDRDADADATVAERRRYVDEQGRRSARPRWRRGRTDDDQGEDGSEADPTARSRSWSSRALHRLGDASAHAGAGLAAAAFVVGWVVFGAAAGFPDWWATTLYAASSSVTLVMVFAIQHTQSRQQMATQRKLDELLRSLPDADDQLIAAETADDHELAALRKLNADDRERARQDATE